MLTCLVVLASSLATYAIHTRAHYDDLDQVLASTARHIASEDVGAAPEGQLGQLLEVPPAAGIVTRVYDGSGRLLISSPATSPAPAIDPLQGSRAPQTVPFDAIAGLAPPFVHVDREGGMFFLGQGGDGVRWRVFLMHLGSDGRYLELASSMRALDDSVARLRLLLLLSGGLGAGIAFVAAWLLAGRALLPIRVLTSTAARIARSRSFSARVPASSGTDELGLLSSTFNQMLESLEVAYLGQQRFVADASHELRAPLTAIQANLELLESRPEMPAADRKLAIREASGEAGRLSRLVADLLALARADAGLSIRRAPVELDRLVLDAAQEARSFSGGRQIEVEKLEPVLIEGDSDRLKQLLLILLDNAVKYSPAKRSVCVRLLNAGGSAEVRVRDSGVGISKAELPHVFERFYRADRARGRDPGGTGLGLPIARWIVEQHSGTIELESEPGKGTEAIVRIPVQAANVAG